MTNGGELWIENNGEAQEVENHELLTSGKGKIE